MSGDPLSPGDPAARARRKYRGFTLLELLVVLAVVALLLSIVMPRYFQSISRAEESVLKENLHRLRETIDRFHADTGKYPDSLEQLVERRYLRAIPVDPLTRSADWTVVAPPDRNLGLVFDVRSNAKGAGIDGKAYGEW